MQTIKTKSVPIRLEFTEVGRNVWESQYTLDKHCFRIMLMHYGYQLEVPKRFLVQFKTPAASYYIKTTSYEDAHRIAQLIYKGKAAAIEKEIVFLRVD